MTETYKSGYTLEKLQALQESIAEGVLKVKYSDKEVEYRSLTQMLKTEALMMKRLGLCKNSTSVFGGKSVNIITSKGL